MSNLETVTENNLVPNTKAKIKTTELMVLTNLITRVVPKKSTVETTKNLVKLTRFLKYKLEEFFEEQKLLFAGYGVEVENDKYEWHYHKDKKEIDTKVEELFNTVVLLTPSNFMSVDEFYAMADQFPVGQLELLEKVLSENPV